MTAAERRHGESQDDCWVGEVQERFLEFPAVRRPSERGREKYSAPPSSLSYPRKIISIAGVSRITQGKGSRMVAPARGGGGSCVESLGLY